MFNNFNLIQLLWRALWSVLGSFIATLGQWWQTVVGWNLTTWQWGLIALGTFLVLWLVLSYWRRIVGWLQVFDPRRWINSRVLVVAVSVALAASAVSFIGGFEPTAIWWWGWTTGATLALLFLGWAHIDPTANQPGQLWPRFRKPRVPIPDIRRQRRINAFTWNAFYRPVLSLLFGFGITALIWLFVSTVCWLLEVEQLIPWNVWVVIAITLSAYAGFVETKEPLVVPGTKFVAMLTWLGIPLHIYLKTGNYDWQGTAIGFGRTTKVMSVFSDDDGFIKAGEVPFKVWDQPDPQNPNTIISAPAKNRADIKATLTLVLQAINPRPALDSDDPALDIGDRARQEYRELVNRFVDTDVPALAESIEALLRGQRLITAFMPKSLPGHKAGAMIRDLGGDAIFEVITGEDGEDQDAVIKRLMDRIQNFGDPKMRKLITKDRNGGQVEFALNYVEIKRPLTEVTGALGFDLIRATVGDIVLSKPVTDAANKASGEVDERVAQLASATTQREVRERLLPTDSERDNPGWQLAMVLAAAQDDQSGNIKVILTPDGNALTRAAVVGANQIGGA